MGFGRILGYIFCIIWIIASLFVLPYSLIWIWAPFVIIVVLRRQAKREVRMEEYAKSQAESLERMANRSGIINANAHEVLDEDDYQNKELASKDEFWVYDKQGKPLMKIHKEDKKLPITEKLDIDNVNGNNNKELEDARMKLEEDQKKLEDLEREKQDRDNKQNQNKLESITEKQKTEMEKLDKTKEYSEAGKRIRGEEKRK